MMIKSERGYQKTIKWLNTFESELEELKEKYLPQNPEKYKILSAGTIEQIEIFRKEIIDYQNKYIRKAS